MAKKLLMISTDRKIFEEGSAVRARQIEYAKNFDEVNIIVFSDKKFTEQSLSPNLFAYPTRAGSKLSAAFKAMSLGQFIIEKRGITEITCQDPFFTGMVGVSMKKRFKLPLELQLHTDLGSSNFTYNWGNKIRKFLALNYLPKADHIRVVSKRIKNYLVEYLNIDEAKIEVRPIAVDTEWIKNASITVNLRNKYPQFSKIVLMASRLEKEKNFALAIHVWKLVTKKRPDAGLVIVGEGSERSHIEQMIDRMNLRGKVIIEPWADKQTLASYYKTADLFFNTSLYEGYGMTFVESQAANLPVVATDVGVAKETGAMTGNTAEQLAELIISKI